MKEMNHKYIILQQPKLKIRLLAGSEFWNVVVAGVQYNITIWMEALFASLIYDPNDDSKTEIMKYIASRYNKSATPVHAEKFITLFKAEHPAKQLQACDLSDVQLLNTKDDGCAIPIYKYDCAITKEDEQVLLNKIQDNPETSKKMLENFFGMYMVRFNQSYYPKWGDGMEAKYLAENFLAMHGIRIANNQYRNKTTASDLWLTALVCCIIVTAIFLIAGFCGLLDGWTKWIVFFVASPCYFIMLNTSLRYSATRKYKKK